MSPLQCVTYGSTASAQRTAQTNWTGTTSALSSALTARNVPAAKALFDRYFRHGVMSLTRIAVTDSAALHEFAIAKPTTDAYKQTKADLLSWVTAAPPTLRNPASPTSGTLKGAGGAGQNVNINYTPGAGASVFDQTTTPALIAGGTGSLISQLGTFTDRRDINGSYALVPTADARGMLTNVALHLENVDLLVRDSIDFCPGGLGSSSAQLVTLPLSRLERTPHPGGGGWTQPVLWQAVTTLDNWDSDVTTLYPANDSDHDGVPDTQPWPGATYRLDNWPTLANPGQFDANSDGVGDACHHPGAAGQALSLSHTPGHTELRARFRLGWQATIVYNLAGRDAGRIISQ